MIALMPQDGRAYFFDSRRDPNKTWTSLTLITSTLDSLATVFVPIFRLSKKIVKKLDAIRRSFFWAAEEFFSGGKCIIAWKDVCQPKESGGLGNKNP